MTAKDEQRMQQMEFRIKHLEEHIMYQQKDIEMLSLVLEDTQTYLTNLYGYVETLKQPEVHHHYYKVTYNYPKEDQ